MNELEVFFAEDDADVQGFRTVNVTEPDHPYAGAWWPPGHILGYEHTFVHTMKDLMDGIKAGKSPAPTFEDGYRCQAVLDAVERSAASGEWTKTRDGRDLDLAAEPRVTIWNEYRHEKSDEQVAKIYPEGIHATLAAALAEAGFEVRTATLDEPEHGLTDEVLDSTDVLLWWGHMAHDEVSDEMVEKVHERVLGGMGLIVLHSGHFSKIFKKLMGTTCDLKWRHDDTESLWVVAPGHPIAEGHRRVHRARGGDVRRALRRARSPTSSSS